MIRADKILTAFFGGVGFKQPTLSGLPTVSAANLASSSGMYFEDGNFLVTIKNIYDTQDDPDISDTEFNTLLSDMQKSSILEVINKVAESKTSFLQSQNLYQYEKSFSTTLTPSDRAVGFQIEPYREGVILEIPWVELSFDTAKTFNLYLYNSNLSDPIQTKSVTTSAGESKIVDLNWYISDDATYKGGNFYVVYMEDDLDGAKAYKKDFELSNLQKSTIYYNIEPMVMSHTGTAIDVTSVSETAEVHGLNMAVNVYSDLTELFIRNKSLFWNAIKHQMTEKVLNMIITSTRTNITERINQAKVSFYGSQDLGIEGISSKINRAVEDLKTMLFYQPYISKGTLK